MDPNATTTVALETNSNTNELMESIKTTIPEVKKEPEEILEATPEQVVLPPVIPTTTTLNKTKDNKPRPHTPFDFDAFVSTIPPTLVAPTPLPDTTLIPKKYIDNIEFCYRLLYFVRNNKNNQTDELKTIAKIIMEYYAPNDTTYFNFELKKIDLKKVDVGNIKIYTNKGEQKLSDIFIEIITKYIDIQTILEKFHKIEKDKIEKDKIEEENTDTINYTNTDNIYFEKQKDSLCGIHALNNALQKKVFVQTKSADGQIGFITPINNDKNVEVKDKELQNQNYLTTTIIEAVKLIAYNNYPDEPLEYYEIPSDLIRLSILYTINDGPDEYLIISTNSTRINLKFFRIVFNKSGGHYTSAFYDENKKWVYLDSTKDNPIFYDLFMQLVKENFDADKTKDNEWFQNNMGWLCAFIPKAEFDGKDKKKGGRTRKHKTFKNRISKSKIKGVTIKMH